MTIISQPAAPTAAVAGAISLRSAVGAFLARYKGQSRIHTESDLNAFLRWCEQADLPPVTMRRVDLELYLRWMQVTCKYKPSTVSRRLSVVTGFYRTCVIDGVLEHSPAEFVRRPRVHPNRRPSACHICSSRHC